jgi:hypothetical protein
LLDGDPLAAGRTKEQTAFATQVRDGLLDGETSPEHISITGRAIHFLLCPLA